jgi:hypothetical protein
MNNHRIRHADLVLRLAEKDQRLLDALAIVKRLSRRSRKFRRGLAGHRGPRVQPVAERASHLRLIASGGVA